MVPQTETMKWNASSPGDAACRFTDCPWTWAMGGWMWGGTDEAESIRTTTGPRSRH